MNVGPGDGRVAIAGQGETPRVIHVSVQGGFGRELQELDLRRRVRGAAGSDGPSLENLPAVVRYQRQHLVLVTAERLDSARTRPQQDTEDY
jgi:hypothetical protein